MKKTLNLEQIPNLINVGVVYDDQKRVLMIKRRIEEIGRNGSVLRWAFPGGRQYVNETPAASVARNILSETGYTVEVMKEISRRKHPHFPVEIIYHLCRIKSEIKRQKPQEPDEVARIEWVKPAKVINKKTTDLDLMVAVELSRLM